MGVLTNIPEGLRYTKDHEWAKLEGKRVRIGITDHAQTELTDVVYVELPPVGKVVKQGEPIGTVESVKAVSEIFAPVTGKVVEVNESQNLLKIELPKMDGVAAKGAGSAG